MLVGCVVVDDQVQGHITRTLAIEMLQKPQPLNVCMSSSRLAEDLAVEIRQCREEGERAVSNVVMSLGGKATGSHPKLQYLISEPPDESLAYRVPGSPLLDPLHP